MQNRLFISGVNSSGWLAAARCALSACGEAGRLPLCEFLNGETCRGERVKGAAEQKESSKEGAMRVEGDEGVVAAGEKRWRRGRGEGGGVAGR